MLQEFEFWSGAALDVQRAWKAYKIRAALIRQRRERAVRRIQPWWRGCIGRAKADKLFLDKLCTKIQKVFKRFTIRREFKRYRAQASAAIVRIQTAFRGRLARRQRDNALWDSDEAERRLYITMLESESAYLQQEQERIAKVRTLELTDCSFFCANSQAGQKTK
jgi:hypothetical protein